MATASANTTIASSGDMESHDAEDELTPPLFVRIQTIELHNLDFQSNTGNKAKFRNLTYIEVTNIFLFAGSTSGTVYVFSRDTLKFLFIIPFKGGKVCNIACSQDESDIAVGSIRGKVSIYRISPTVHYMQSSSSASLLDAFRDIYDVPHHVGAEITELQWSPNGKYLFVGDSQGVVSQMDVACLEEFPRPVPSRVILKLPSRVLQIDSSFPYLAVSTLNSVCLCDLEKEDFTRIQQIKNKDIRSTGLSFMILPERSSSIQDLSREGSIPSAKLVLFIAEAGTGTMYCCNMEGAVQKSHKVEVSKNLVTKRPMHLFDPMKQTEEVSTPEANGEDHAAEEDEEEVSISLGKMLCTDDGLIISVSTDKIFVLDPYTMNAIAWNEDLKRINNFKIISNYIFIWAGNKMEVFAFTQFRSYAEQLYRAKLFGVLKSWIEHTIYSLGWRSRFNSSQSQIPQSISADSLEEQNTPECDSNGATTLLSNPDDEDVKMRVILNFRKMLFGEAEDEKEFTKYVKDNLPFSLELECSATESVQDEIAGGSGKVAVVEEEETIIERYVRQFSTRVQSHIIHPPPMSETFSRSSSSESYGVSGRNRVSSILSHVIAKADEKDNYPFLAFSDIWSALTEFYENIGCALPCLDYKKSELTLYHVINATRAFLGQPKVNSLLQEIGEIAEASIFEDITILMISLIYCEQNHYSNKKLSSKESSIFGKYESFNICFTKFGQCPPIMKWFLDMGTLQETVFYDSLLADTLLLLLPFMKMRRNDFGEIDRPLLVICLESLGTYERLPNYFMTWLFLCKFLSEPKQVPYSPLLRSLLNDKLFENLAEEMFSTIYRDFRLSTFDSSAQYLHHFVSALVLLSKSTEFGHPRSVSVLLTCFPLVKWAREDIITKIIEACHLNPMLLRLYMKSCLEDGNSLKLCACGIQAGFGTLEGKVSPFQRAIEEAIIKLLLEEYFKSSPNDEEEEEEEEEEENGNGRGRRRTEVVVHVFAMRRGLLEPYFRSPLPDEFLSDDLQAELIIRSGSCAPLKHFQCNERNMSLILRCYQYHLSSSQINNNEIINNNSTSSSHKTGSNILKNGKSDPLLITSFNGEGKPKMVQSNRSPKRIAEWKGKGRCSKCSHPLQLFTKSFKPISRDCLGMWALKQIGSTERFIKLVQSCRLNVKATFSARFYRAVAIFHDQMYRSQNNQHQTEDLDLSDESSILSCSIFHDRH